MIPRSYKIVLKNLGILIPLVGIMALISILISIILKEYFAVLPLLLTALISFSIGALLFFSFRNAPDAKLKHGMIIAGLGWLIVALIGALPFYFTAIQITDSITASQTVLNFANPLNCFFESLSGFTGTGLTMTAHENLLPHSLQWWRSFIQWIGGVGIIVLMLSIIYVPGQGSYSLYYAEAREEKIHPSVISTVRTIWKIYVLYTIVGVFILWGSGMPLWDSVNHSMTGIATGGFSVTDNSIGTYGNQLIELSLIPLMMFGAVSFAVHYSFLKGKFKKSLRDVQTRWLFIFTLTGVVILNIENLFKYLPFDSLRYSLFQFVSAITCTGFQSVNIQNWSFSAQIIMTAGMILGGAAGSTAGGIKILRGVILIKGVFWRLIKITSPPSALIRFKLTDKSCDENQASRQIETAAILFFLWIVFLGIGIIILSHTVPGSYNFANVMFEVASAQSNVGLSTGITGPGMSPLAKASLCFNMWIGRLEIIPILLLFRSLFS